MVLIVISCCVYISYLHREREPVGQSPLKACQPHNKRYAQTADPNDEKCSDKAVDRKVPSEDQ